ncbi:Cytochrome oxidase assembly [Arachnomyces sp. PD_36]|nr:Cytochrome oxidase assembly [Arachnomyces sp. PD_36]
MPAFSAKPFRPSVNANSPLGARIGATYRAHLSKHPFLLFGLPFIGIMVAGSFFLTPATALRYERHDRKVQQLSQEEAMGLGLKGPDGEGVEGVKKNPRRRVVGSEREEYYKLMAKDLDNWEQKRVKRFEGEPDGRI